MVIYQWNWEEVLKRIKDKSGAKPGGPGMFKHYQAAVKIVMAELSNNKLEKIQAQVTHKKGPVYMEYFLKKMWRQCRMRVFVMSAWKNEQGEVLFGIHDDNEEDIELVWQEYVQEQFGHGMDDNRWREVKKRIRKPAFKLKTDRDGMPLLPDITKTKLEEKKAIARAFLTLHYWICSGIDKAAVPWSAIIQSQDDFVARKYVPADVDLKEPSKLQNWDTTTLLNFWHAQQEKGDGPTFLFKAWKNKDGDMVASVVSGNSPSHQTCKVRKQMIQRPQNSSTNTKSDSHHMEDDADDDVADGRSPQKRPRREPDPLTAHEGTVVLCATPKPCPVKPAKTGALLTSQMGDLLAGLTNRVTSNVEEDVVMEGGHTSPVLKNMWGKKW
ncbi:uncharacterized protein BJ212DRAFT_1476677 [Suillus subaureus]|uniref:Uncharacterized protein n=1 Tax=Suillus subaureus TaxID=48587 RepID=A0A9P7JI58_9AGAM|nr:uncharacterized protein BJ212DRAFT_1476677 [Suillus subaureus]KAG1823815.1 hypothetical protein BJ212DRAFT_1476677 [Suillus subaureus]